MAPDIKKTTIKLWEVFRDTFKRWNEAGPWRQSAILAYYSIFSLPALLLIVIVIVGYVYGEDAVSRQLSHRISDMIGEDSARIMENMIANTAQTGSSTVAFIAGIGFLLFGATSVFYHLQVSLNRIWGVVPKPKKAFLKYLKDRLLSFGLILAIGFLLLTSMILNSMVAALRDWIFTHWPEAGRILSLLTNYGLAFVVTTTMFALLFKFLPDALIRWRSVWIGSLLTSVLFTLGQYSLSLYFGNFDPGLAYGAAGAIILILVWVSYVAMIVLFGAEFTRQWANKFGHGIRPKKSAVLLEEIDDKYHYSME